MTDQKDAISGAIKALEEIMIFGIDDGDLGVISNVLSQLRTLQADYVLVRKADIPEGCVVEKYRYLTNSEDGDIFIEFVGNRKWAITRNGAVLNNLNEWEYQPLPSNRDEDFLARTRHDCPVKAAAILNAANTPAQKRESED
jgi:hypothetical protein